MSFGSRELRRRREFERREAVRLQTIIMLTALASVFVIGGYFITGLAGLR
jgi:hypothetical protein